MRSRIPLAILIATLSLPFLTHPLPARSAPPTGFPDTPLQDLLVRQWTLDDGLPTETLTDVLQTRDGFLWISTFEGLLRFDGHDFELFDKARIAAQRAETGALALQSDSFFSLDEDSDGGLWVSNQAGDVLHFSDDIFRIFPTPVEGDIRELWIDAPDNIWIAGQTLLHGDPRRALETVEISEDRSLGADSLLRHEGSLWIGSDHRGLIELRDDGTERTYTIEDGLAANAVNSLEKSCDGGLWIGHWDGLSHLAAGRIRTTPEMRGISIHRMILDQSCDLWMATSKGLARRRSAGVVEWFLPEHGGPKEAYSLTFDREGLLWVAGITGGLYRFKRGMFTGITHRRGLAPGTVEALVERRDGTLIAAVGPETLFKIDQGRVTQRIEIPEAPNTRAAALFEDSRGVLWIGTYQGLLGIGPQERRHFSSASGFPSSQIRAIREDRFGSLWIGTANRGMIEMRPDDSLRVLDHSKGLLSNFVFSVSEDLDENLLFAVRGGFHVLSPESGALRTFTAGRDFPGGTVFTVYADLEENLWLSTDAGLIHFDGERFRVIDKKRGLPVGKVFDYVEDDRGWAWMSTGSGILRAEKNHLLRFLDGDDTELRIDAFDQEDGMTHRQCTGARSVLKTSDGRIWFPTNEGITIVDPVDVEFNVGEPPVAIERFEVDGTVIGAQAADAYAERSVDPGPHRYVFDFAVLSYRNPAKNRARYRLLGYNDQWTEVTDERRAVYTNLPHGRYVFEVIGADATGPWNERGAWVAFSVRPFFHETLVFRAAVVLFFVLLLAELYRRRINKIEARHEKIRRVAEERRVLLDQLQARNDEIDRYLNLFAHDLKNPLVTIRSFAGMAQKDIEDEKLDRATRDIVQVYGAADQLNQLLDDLLMLAEVGRARVTSSVLDLDAMARAAIEEHSKSLIERGVTVEILEKLPQAVGVRRQIAEVFDELFENALKFFGETEEPRIEIGVRHEVSEICCWVRDNGMGIAAVYHEKVFQLLHQLDRQTPGTGAGLALVRRVIEEHGGRTWIESEGPGMGTAVFFTLPSGKGKTRR